ncbi:hypothetical protein TWF730_004063 [Orbilia blumenaviensis]|uniref:Uncharacterized protein n=1 Tax=Orbilia blumenaviensis TaxID=1796055 RepID=A0AAV9U5T0_9PEZI
MSSSLPPPAAVTNPLQQQPERTTHSRYFHRVSSSQRSHSPPPSPDRKPICTVIKNVLCFSLCGRKRPDSDDDDYEDDEGETEDARIEAKLLDLEESVISSEEQTKAPEGDRLPVFTRLRDWTEHQREEARRKRDGEREWRRRQQQQEEEEEREERNDGMPPRPASMPVPASNPIPPGFPRERRRRRSDGQLHKPRRDGWRAGTIRKWDNPVFEEEFNIPARKPVPSPPSPLLTPPRSAENWSAPNLFTEPNLTGGRIYSNPPQVLQKPMPTREARPVVPPKIPLHAGNYGYDSAPGPDFKEDSGQRRRGPFLSVNLQRMGEILPAVLGPGRLDNDSGSLSSSSSSSSSPTRKHRHLKRKKAKKVAVDSSHPHHTHGHGMHYHHHHKSHRTLKDDTRRRKNLTPSSMYVEVEVAPEKKHHKQHCRKHRHKHRCRRHYLEEAAILNATEVPQVVWGGYYRDPVLWQRYDFI